VLVPFHATRRISPVKRKTKNWQPSPLRLLRGGKNKGFRCFCGKEQPPVPPAVLAPGAPDTCCHCCRCGRLNKIVHGKAWTQRDRPEPYLRENVPVFAPPAKPQKIDYTLAKITRTQRAGDQRVARAFRCFCGKEAAFSRVAFAHWNETLYHKCACGRSNKILRGEVWTPVRVPKPPVARILTKTEQLQAKWRGVGRIARNFRRSGKVSGTNSRHGCRFVAVRHGAQY
jgi:hypothetical protein